MHITKRHSTSRRVALSRPTLVACSGLVIGIVTSLGACSAPPADDVSAERASEALTPGALQACPSGSNAIVIAFAPAGETPACADVRGTGGTWVYSGTPTVRTCVPTRDPERGQPYACTYDWVSGSGTPSASPDTSALDALPDAYVAEAASSAKTCGDPAMLSYAALLDGAGVTCPPLPGSGGPDGPRPCEVCGVPLFPGVIYGSMWLPASNDLHTVSIGLSNGTRQILTIGVFETRGGGTRRGATRGAAMTGSRVHHAYVPIALPALPRGVHYEDGPALGYGYGAPSTR